MLIVESYGGRDEPVDTLTNNFVGVGVEPALDAVRIKEVPNEATYQVIAASLLSVHICLHISDQELSTFCVVVSLKTISCQWKVALVLG